MNIPLAAAALFESRQAKITLAPLLAKSIAVSLPIPVLAPVIITVFPFNRFVLVQKPVVSTKYNLMAPRIDPIMINPE